MLALACQFRDPFASAQGALQYLLPFAGTQLQAGCAHLDAAFIRNSFLWTVPGTLSYWVTALIGSIEPRGRKKMCSFAQK
jgi:hypothetical protein